MRIWLKEPGDDKPFRRMVVPNELKVFQDLVGGYIEVITLSPKLALIVNEEGKLKGLKPNFWLGEELIVGNVLMVGVDGDEFTDGPEEANEMKPILMKYKAAPYGTVRG